MLWLASSYNATRQTYCVFVGWFSQPPRSSCSMQQFGQTDETEDVSRAAAWPSYHARSLCSRFTRTVCRPCTLDATCPPGSRVLAAGVLPTAPLRLSSISSFRPTPNAVISAVGYKLRLVFRWLRTLLRQLPLVVLGPNPIPPHQKSSFLTGNSFNSQISLCVSNLAICRNQGFVKIYSCMAFRIAPPGLQTVFRLGQPNRTGPNEPIIEGCQGVI